METLGVDVGVRLQLLIGTPASREAHGVVPGRLHVALSLMVYVCPAIIKWQQLSGPCMYHSPTWSI